VDWLKLLNFLGLSRQSWAVGIAIVESFVSVWGRSIVVDFAPKAQWIQPFNGQDQGRDEAIVHCRLIA
jgi:hypothetical protein